MVYIQREFVLFKAKFSPLSTVLILLSKTPHSSAETLWLQRHTKLAQDKTIFCTGNWIRAEGFMPEPKNTTQGILQVTVLT